MNRFGSHLNHENLILYEGLPPQGLFRGTAGQGVFFKFFGHRSATGAPRRGWRHSSYQRDRVIIISASYLKNTIFMGNAQLPVNAGRRFHPRRCGSPDAITPEQVLRHHRSAQGRHGGTGSCPLLHSYQHPEFHIKGKGILQSH